MPYRDKLFSVTDQGSLSQFLVGRCTRARDLPSVKLNLLKSQPLQQAPDRRGRILLRVPQNTIGHGGLMHLTLRLLRRPYRTALLELIDQAIEIGIANAQAPRKPVSPALGYPLTISDNLELTCLPRLNHGFNIEALLD